MPAQERREDVSVLFGFLWKRKKHRSLGSPISAPHTLPFRLSQVDRTAVRFRDPRSALGDHSIEVLRAHVGGERLANRAKKIEDPALLCFNALTRSLQRMNLVAQRPADPKIDRRQQDNDGGKDQFKPPHDAVLAGDLQVLAKVLQDILEFRLVCRVGLHQILVRFEHRFRTHVLVR